MQRRGEPSLLAARRTRQALALWTLFLLAVAGGWLLLHPEDAAAQFGDDGGEQLPTDGEFLWKRDCVSCHGPQGHGTPWGPPIQGQGPAGVSFMLTSGRMPLEDLRPLATRDYDVRELQVDRKPAAYTPAQIDAIVEHTRAFLDGPEVPEVDIASADLARGEELFQANCAACHMWSGRGGALTDGRIAVSLVEATPVEVVAAMRMGVGTMPVFSEETVPDDDAAAIAAYVDFLREPSTPGGSPLAFLGPVAEGFVAWMVGIVTLLLAVRWIGQRS